MNDSGFLVVENVFSGSECDHILEVLSDSTIKRGRAGARNLMSNPEISKLASDRRLLDIAESLLGRSVIPYKATLFDKSGKANWLVAWHQDTALPLADRFEQDGWGPWSKKADTYYAHAPDWALSRIIAIRVHLDASTLVNGPLRVIPGSHKFGVMTSDEVTRLINTRDHYECLVSRGGILAMSPLLIHSSSKADNNNPRRVLHLEYADSLKLDSGIRLAVA